ncbi:endocuticle structural glycoprotein SgAbd-2-like [Homarus americanus]|uniref:endocuticle structural glycoprotein SgAbd-2-like n=1 Tax=Homarus americanus TaxID=6706 RepID=UPI001C46FB62|nr:endocuticle structural glycoprotein SgAbd-2-like [Homarus americanus]
MSLPRASEMKFVILSTVAALAIAAPQYGYNPPPVPTPTEPPYTYGPPEPPQTYGAPDHLLKSAGEVVEVVPILKDERTQEDDGTFTLDVETGNSISLYQAGSPSGPDGAVVQTGRYSYPAPDGTIIEVQFVADENGFQPESDILPVAPAFPHPIPQFVLDQIAFAAEEDRAEAAAVRSAPSPTYGAPQ